MQITLDEDLNVPDARPDAQMIIQSRERVTLEHTRAESGKLYVDGYMEIGILYLDDTKQRQLQRLDTKLPFDEVIAVEGLEAGDNVRVRYETEDLNVTLINSRKLAVRALLSFSSVVDEVYDMSAAVETQSELKLCERRKKLELLQLEVQKKDIMRLRQEIQIPSNKPNIGEILWDSVQLRGCRIALRDGKFTAQGSLFVFVLYRTDDEAQSVQWQEQQVPFEGELECTGCREGLIPDMEITLVQPELTAKEDTDGELRLFHLEGVLEFEIRLYDTGEAEILEDIYSPEKELELTTSREVCESLVMKNESKCKASGRIRIQGAKPRILQICHSSGSIKIDSTQMIEEGIRVEGAVPVSILYITSDDTMPFAVLEGIIPFTHTAQVPGIDADCRFTLTADMEQLTAVMADSEEIEVRVTIGLNLFVARAREQQCIRAVSEKDYAMEQLEAVPGITGYIVQGNETLWDIAKQYYLTPQQIMEMNGLESEEIKKGDCLILMKNVVKLFSFLH
jgi:hypothetical protein